MEIEITTTTTVQTTASIVFKNLKFTLTSAKHIMLDKKSIGKEYMHDTEFGKRPNHDIINVVRAELKEILEADGYTYLNNAEPKKVTSVMVTKELKDLR